MDANLARQVLLQQPEGARLVPLAAWPIILLRVNLLLFWVKLLFRINPCSSSKSPFDHKTSMFFLLQNGPVLFENWRRRKEENPSTAQAQAGSHPPTLERKYDDADNSLMHNETAEKCNYIGT